MTKFLIDSLQPKLVAQFARIIDRKQLAQSYLFVGPKGLASWPWLSGSPCAYFAKMCRMVRHVASVLSASEF